jgi:hypothetical protein
MRTFHYDKPTQMKPKKQNGRRPTQILADAFSDNFIVEKRAA